MAGALRQIVQKLSLTGATTLVLGFLFAAAVPSPAAADSNVPNWSPSCAGPDVLDTPCCMAHQAEVGCCLITQEVALFHYICDVFCQVWASAADYGFCECIVSPLLVALEIDESLQCLDAGGFVQELGFEDLVDDALRLKQEPADA